MKKAKSLLGFAAAVLAFTSTASAAQFDCATTTTIVKYARERHYDRKKLEIISAETGLKTAIHFTDRLVEDYSWFLTASEVAALKQKAAAAQGKAIADGLIGADCRFFEQQTKVLERAFWRFKANFFTGVDKLVDVLLAAPVLSAEQLQKRKPYATHISEIRARRLEEIVFLIANDELVKSGEFTRKQAAKNMLYQMRNILNAFRSKLVTYAYEGAVKSFVAALDPHSAYLTGSSADEFISERENQIGLGVVLSMAPVGVRVAKVFPRSPAADSGKINEGDIIFAVNGRSVLGVTVSEVASWVRGKKGSTVHLQIGRAKKGGMINVREIDVVRDEIRQGQMMLAHERKQVRGKSILVIKFDEFYGGVAEDLRLTLWSEQKKASVDAVVLDLRGNPGGIVDEAALVASLFTEKGPVVLTDSGETQSESLYNIFPGVTYYRGPLVLAVNNGSGSASEILAGALKDYRRAIIAGGSHTNGKGNFQSVYTPKWTEGRMPVGALVLTRGLYYTAGGTSPQFDGVQSDIVVPGPSYDVSYEERSSPNALESGALEMQLHAYTELKANQDKFLKKALPVLKAASEQRIFNNPRFGAGKNPTLADQMDEILNIAADHAQAVSTTCVMHQCAPPTRF